MHEDYCYSVEYSIVTVYESDWLKHIGSTHLEIRTVKFQVVVALWEIDSECAFAIFSLQDIYDVVDHCSASYGFR